MIKNRNKIRKVYQEQKQEENNVTGLEISDMGLLCKDNDIEIETKCGLDHNSLIRIKDEYYVATRNGKKVELCFDRIQGGNIIIYSMETKKNYEKNEKLKNELKDFILYLEYYLNRFGYQRTAKNRQWTISIDSKKLELPLTPITFSELSRALESILEQINQQKTRQ